MSQRTIPGVPTDGLKPSDLLWASILNKPSNFPPSAHSHVAGDLPGTIAYRDQGNTFNASQSINGSLLVNNGTVRFAGADLQHLLGINGASYGLRIGSYPNVGMYLDAVDPTLNSSYQPLAIGGSAISLNAPTTVSGAIKNNTVQLGVAGYSNFANGLSITDGVFANASIFLQQSDGSVNAKCFNVKTSLANGAIAGLAASGTLNATDAVLTCIPYGSAATPALTTVLFKSGAGSYLAGNIRSQTYAANYGYSDLILGASPNINSSTNYDHLIIKGATGNVLVGGSTDNGSRLQVAGDLSLTSNGQLLRNGVNLWCNQGDSISVNTDANATDYGPHYYASNLPPGGVVGYGTRQGLSSDYPNYGVQTFIPRYYEPYLWIRRLEAGSWDGWTKVSAGNSDNLGGIAASGYARRDLPNTFSENQTVGGTGFGKLVISQGTSSVSGYIQWLRWDGSRIGYMGYDAGNDISLVNEQAGGALRVAGAIKSGAITGTGLISSYYTDSTDSNLGAQIYLGDDNFNNVTYSKSAPGIGAVYSTTTSVRGDLGVYGYTAASTTRQLIALFKAGGSSAFIPYCPVVTQSTVEFKGATVANSNWWKAWASDSVAGNFYIQSNNSGRGIQVRATGGLLVNAMTTGTALEVQQAGVSNFNVTSSGTVSASGAMTLGANSFVGTSSGRLDLRPSDGRVALYDGSQSYYMDLYSGNTKTVSINSDLLGKITTIGSVEAVKGVYAGESYLNYAGAGNNYLTGITYFRDPSTGYANKAFVNSINGIVYGKQLTTDNALIDYSDGNTYFGNSSVVVRDPTTNVAGVTLGGINGTVTATGDTHKLGTTLIGTGAFGGSWSVITQDSTISASTYAFSANTASGTYLNCPVGLQIAFRCANVDMLRLNTGQANLFAAAGLRVRNDTNTADAIIVCGSIFASGNISGAAYSVKSLSTDPTASDLAAGYSRVFKNTSSGSVRLWANDGGVMRSVTLT